MVGTCKKISRLESIKTCMVLFNFWLRFKIRIMGLIQDINRVINKKYRWQSFFYRRRWISLNVFYSNDFYSDFYGYKYKKIYSNV